MTARDGAPPRVRGRPGGAQPVELARGSTPARAGPTRTRRVTSCARWEHPRACGADTDSRPTTRPPYGAPPRVRGRHRVGRPALPDHRSTPARAGPTARGARSCPGTAEHPRACGADGAIATPRSRRRGAPPRVRGRRVGVALSQPLARSTPARAGPTTTRGRLGAGHEEHPRACGADVIADGGCRGSIGAPPRVRGRHGGSGSAMPDRRSTPARAGPTRPGRTVTATPREHPRACGADGMLGGMRRSSGGAPPRVRGRPQVQQGRLTADRSTPARAGPTESCRRPASTRPEHPRACGADGHRGAPRARPRGAPPRVRGRRPGGGERGLRLGSTPARAGPTPSAASGGRVRREHPRACGADRPQARRQRDEGGAPPRVRGRRVLLRQARPGARSTPARAGPTTWPSRTGCRRREHPRACGADRPGLAGPTILLGAPPRVRGRPGGRALRNRVSRSTPARAGPTGPGW